MDVIELENRDVIVSSDLDGDNGRDPSDYEYLVHCRKVLLDLSGGALR